MKKSFVLGLTLVIALSGTNIGSANADGSQPGVETHHSNNGLHTERHGNSTQLSTGHHRKQNRRHRHGGVNSSDIQGTRTPEAEQTVTTTVSGTPEAETSHRHGGLSSGGNKHKGHRDERSESTPVADATTTPEAETESHTSQTPEAGHHGQGENQSLSTPVSGSGHDGNLEATATAVPTQAPATAATTTPAETPSPGHNGSSTGGDDTHRHG